MTDNTTIELMRDKLAGCSTSLEPEQFHALSCYTVAHEKVVRGTRYTATFLTDADISAKLANGYADLASKGLRASFTSRGGSAEGRQYVLSVVLELPDIGGVE